MKAKSVLNRHPIMMSLSVSIAWVFFVFWPCTGEELDKTVQQAYELRMNGQADSAKVHLEQAIAEDSTHAAAWYELARTKHHIGLRNPRELFEGLLEDIQQTIEKAVENDPDNAMYSYYKAVIDHTILYMCLKIGKDDVTEDFTKAVESYKHVLILKPDYHEAKLSLVELYANLPPDMGGDSAMAEKYVRELEEADVVFGAKAREMVMLEYSTYVAFWQKIIESQMDNADVHEAMGKAYLYNDNVEEAIKCFDKAIRLDSNKNILYVVLGRYHLMQAMQDPEMINSVAPLIENALETYLNSQPEPIDPLKAFVIGKLAMIKFQTGDEEGGNKLYEEAMALDPYFSKAFGTPSQILFDPPDEISRAHTYFFRPF